MSLTLYISSNCKSPIICDFEFFLRVRSQTQVFVVFAVKDCPGPRRDPGCGRDPHGPKFPFLLWISADKC